MPDGEHFNGIAVDSIGKQVRIAINDQFPGAGQLAAPTEQRMIGENTNLVPDGACNPLGCARAFCRDVVVNFDQVVARTRRKTNSPQT